MRKLLFLLFALCATVTVRAQRPNTEAMSRLAQAPMAKGKSHAAITPEGTPRAYEMDAYLMTSYGMRHATNIASTLYFADDSRTVYFSSFFPTNFPPADLWARGTVEGDKVTFDCEEPIYYLAYADDSHEPEPIMMGELILDEIGNTTGVKDMVLLRDGDRFYVEDTPDDFEHYYGLYLIIDGDIAVYSFMSMPNLVPFEGNTARTELPAAAQMSDYVYYSTTIGGNNSSVKGKVATAPSATEADATDYYFDTLLPELPGAWIKGTRHGSTITVPTGQYLGNESGFYIYFQGFSIADNADGEFADITFSVDSDGCIRLDNPAETCPAAYYYDGSLYTSSYGTVIEPAGSDESIVPSAPYDLLLTDDQYEMYQGYTFDFCLDHLTPDGKYIAPEDLGYYIYIDDDRYTFRQDVYAYIGREEMTLVPYGFSDMYKYDFYSRDSMNELFIYEDMFERVGVQAVYTKDDRTATSDIIYIDLDGNITVVDPAGIATPELSNAEVQSRDYDLSGRRLRPGQKPSLYIRGGRTYIR